LNHEHGIRQHWERNHPDRNQDSRKPTASMYPQGIFPTIVEKSGAYIKQYDVFSRLLEDRIIFIGTPIDDLVADHVVGQLLYLDRSGRNQDIKMYINSPGGSVTAGLAIYDTMQLIEPSIQTYCVGQAASMGAVLLAGGAAGKRFALPHSRIMIHQPWGGAQGTAIDMEIQVKEILKMKAALEEILARHTGRTAKEVNKACDRDNFMSSGEAKAFGLIDQIIEKAPPPENQPK
jgi:ATP-dependent Clp protease protease subunit